jgi:small-conductance mechanosensitive channel
MRVTNQWAILAAQWWEFVLPLGVLVACVTGGFLLRRFLFSWVRSWSARTGHHLDSVVIPALRTPLIIWSLILGLDLATRSSELPRHYVAPFNVGLEVLWLISLTIIAAQVAGNLVRIYHYHAAGVETSTTLTTTLTQIVVFLIGLTILLNYLKVDIKPLLTALGVGGLAVALALQDTLANLFAGFYISVSSQIRLGDYVKLNTGEEGYVTDITWRSTTLRALANNYIFIPNSKLAQAIVTNYNLPSRAMGMNITVRVGFAADTERIEKMLIEEAVKEKIPGLVTDPPPNVSWSPGVGDSAILLSLNFQVEEFVNQFGVQSELRKRVFRRFRREGMEPPYPVQVMITETAEQPARR